MKHPAESDYERNTDIYMYIYMYIIIPNGHVQLLALQNKIYGEIVSLRLLCGVIIQ